MPLAMAERALPDCTFSPRTEIEPEVIDRIPEITSASSR